MKIDTASGQMSIEQLGQGTDLILLHSLLTDRNAFELVLPRLISRVRVTLVDLPGFGDSDPVEPNMDAYADRVGGILEAGDFDPATTAILGNGLGGFVALATAVRHGHRFNKLILVGCGSSVPAEGKPAFVAMMDRVRRGGMEAVADLAIARIFPDEFIRANPGMVRERRAVLLRTDPQAFLTACQAIHDVDYDADVASVTNPTLLLVGSDDMATPPSLSASLHQAMPDSTYIELDSVAHGPQLQAPDRFLDAVEPFLGLPMSA